MEGSLENVKRYTFTFLTSHNYVRLAGNAKYTLNGFANLKYSDGSTKEGEWRSN